MANEPVLLVAQFRAKPEKADEVRRILISVIEPTRSEEGCLFYHLHQNTEDPHHFVFYEGYRSKTAFDTHVATPSIKGFLDRSEELLTDPPQVTFLKYLG
jgi:quinol monooxygenase YgiN